MGLFDYVKCDAPLPDGFTGELQTKDIEDPWMRTHTITREGRLVLQRIVKWEEVPKEQRPYPDAADDDIRSLCGCVRTESAYEDANFHGMLNFYGSDKSGGWHEYVAKFTDGNLAEIKKISDA